MTVCSVSGYLWQENEQGNQKEDEVEEQESIIRDSFKQRNASKNAVNWK